MSRQPQPVYEAPRKRSSEAGTTPSEKFYEPVHIGGSYVVAAPTSPVHAMLPPSRLARLGRASRRAVAAWVVREMLCLVPLTAFFPAGTRESRTSRSCPSLPIAKRSSAKDRHQLSSFVALRATRSFSTRRIGGWKNGITMTNASTAPSTLWVQGTALPRGSCCTCTTRPGKRPGPLACASVSHDPPA